MAGPRADLISAQRSGLTRYFDVVIETRGKRAIETNAERCFVQGSMARIFTEAKSRGRHAPEYIRLEYGFGDGIFERRINSVQVVALIVVVHDAVSGEDDRRCKQADEIGGL